MTRPQVEATKRSVSVSIKITPDLDHAVRRRAYREKISVSDAHRAALRQWAKETP